MDNQTPSNQAEIKKKKKQAEQKKAFIPTYFKKASYQGGNAEKVKTMSGFT